MLHKDSWLQSLGHQHRGAHVKALMAKRTEQRHHLRPKGQLDCRQRPTHAEDLAQYPTLIPLDKGKHLHPLPMSRLGLTG